MTIPCFHKKSFQERLRIVRKRAGLTKREEEVLLRPDRFVKAADCMVENLLGVTPVPLGVATNFVVNGKERLVPMAIEECSVIAAASNGAKLALPEGFRAKSSGSVMIGQVQVVGAGRNAARDLLKAKDRLLSEANCRESTIVKLGGGAKDAQVRVLENGHVVVHLLVDVLDSMGANSVNSMVERIAPLVQDISGGRVRSRIVSNLAVERLCTASAVWRKEALLESFHGEAKGSAEEIVDAILDVYEFALYDPFRAATHNKGIMNGIDAVALATGNDWRAVEAGAHAFAAISGRYMPLTKYWKDDVGDLYGEASLPLPLATIGKSISANPSAMAALKIMGVASSAELSETAACVGLAQNLAALRVLATEGIQKGHMKLYARKACPPARKNRA